MKTNRKSQKDKFCVAYGSESWRCSRELWEIKKKIIFFSYYCIERKKKCVNSQQQKNDFWSRCYWRRPLCNYIFIQIILPEVLIKCLTLKQFFFQLEMQASGK
jgi:hypothetical protein